ncbi:MAG: FIST C-terminal domain-containing protein [Bacteroidota bacterium]
MIDKIIHKPTASQIVSAAKKGIGQQKLTALILLGEEAEIEVEGLISGLNAEGVSFLGGIFPGVIYQTAKYTDACVIKFLNTVDTPTVIPDISKHEGDWLALPEGTTSRPTVLMLVDGLSPNIGQFLAYMHNRWGNAVHYLGGGAGSLSLQPLPCILTKEGALQNAAVLALLDKQVKLGVKHGWRRIMGPFVATDTENTVIKELNWQNAFEVYKQVVETNGGGTITRENFFDIAKGYPFGLTKEGEEDVVRDPITVNEHGHLICVGEVPKNSVLNILKGDKESLVSSAAEAARTCMSEGVGQQDILMIDCISRVLFLGDDFKKELEAVQEEIQLKGKDSVFSGALTLGEISSYGENRLEFFNKTIVMGMMYG